MAENQPTSGDMLNAVREFPAVDRLGNPIMLKYKRIRLRSISQFEEWARSNIVAIGRAQMVDTHNGETIAEARQRQLFNQDLLAEAYRACGRVSFGSPDAVGFLQSIDGMARIYHMGARQVEGSEKMTLDDVFDILDDVGLGTMGRVINDLLIVSGLSEKPPTRPITPTTQTPAATATAAGPTA